MRRMAVVLAAVAVAVGTQVTPAAAAVDPGAKLSAVTGTGLHNTYERSRFGSLGAGLDRLTETGDAGPVLIELDVWTLWRRWIVKHDLPALPAGSNNCTRGTTANQDLAYCLANLKAWSTAHPGHPPVVVKIELKNGFAASSGLGPAQFDALLRTGLGALYRPADLLGGRPDLDSAAAADDWAGIGALRGRFLVLVQTGTFEESNPLDTLKTDVEYATYLRANPGDRRRLPGGEAGRLDRRPPGPVRGGAAAVVRLDRHRRGRVRGAAGRSALLVRPAPPVRGGHRRARDPAGARPVRPHDRAGHRPGPARRLPAGLDRLRRLGRRPGLVARVPPRQLLAGSSPARW